MRFSLFYAIIATVGVVYSSKDVIESNAQLRSLKTKKGGGGKVVKKIQRVMKRNKGKKLTKATKKSKKRREKKAPKATKVLKPTNANAAKKLKKSKEQKSPKAIKVPKTTECLYFSKAKSKEGKRSQKSRIGRVLHRRKFVRRVGKKSKAKSGTSCDPSADLSNNWGQKPGSYVVITSYDNTLMCIQPPSLIEGASLESVPCSNDKSDIFKVDKFGRLHTSDTRLCVTGDDGSLVLGNCNEKTSNSIFLYDEETKMISLFDDPNQVFSLQNGKLFLMAPLAGIDGRKLKKAKDDSISQKWEVSEFSEKKSKKSKKVKSPKAPKATSKPTTITKRPTALDVPPTGEPTDTWSPTENDDTFTINPAADSVAPNLSPTADLSDTPTLSPIVDLFYSSPPTMESTVTSSPPTMKSTVTSSSPTCWKC